MNAQLETTIVDRLHQLDERRLSEVLDFVEFLAARRVSGEENADWKLIDPSRDLARFVGTVPFGEDGVAYQRRIRDTEWS